MIFAQRDDAAAAVAAGKARLDSIRVYGRPLFIQHEKVAKTKGAAASPKPAAPKSDAPLGRGALLQRLRNGKDVAALLVDLAPFTTPPEFTMAISGCGRIRDGQRALDLFAESKAQGLTPGLITYNALLGALARADGEFSGSAIDLLEEMAALGLAPDERTYNAAVQLCVAGGLHRKALSLLQAEEAAGLRESIHIRYYDAAIGESANAGDADGALSLLAEIRKRRFDPNLVTFTSVMQAQCTAARLDEGFALLEEVDAAGLTSSSYSLHRMLIEACRLEGDDERAAAVQARIDRHALSTRNVKARVTVGPKAYTNGAEPPRLAAASRALLAKVRRSTSYAPRLEALPRAYARTATEAAQVDQLTLHAEKKALAALVERGEALEMEVNIGVCLDCHEYLKAASRMLRRPITVRERKIEHRFVDGACSCGDRWRWEERARAKLGSSGRQKKK